MVQISTLIPKSKDGEDPSRFFGMTEEEIFNIVGTHESSHVKKNGKLIKNEMTPTFQELKTLFEYTLLYPSKCSPMSNWLDNYKRSLGFVGLEKEDVFSAYSEALDNLIKTGDIKPRKNNDKEETKEELKTRMMDEFKKTYENTEPKDKKKDE